MNYCVFCQIFKFELFAMSASVVLYIKNENPTSTNKIGAYFKYLISLHVRLPSSSPIFLFSSSSTIFEIYFNLDKPLFFSKTFFSLRYISLPDSSFSVLKVSSTFSTIFNDVAKDRFFVRNLSMATDTIEKFYFIYAKLLSRLVLTKYFSAF